MKYFFTIIILYFLISCNNDSQKENEDYTTIRIRQSDLIKTGNLSNLISEFRLIPLETIQESMIMDINKVEFYRDHFFVFDQQGQKIFKFDSLGNYILQIGATGTAPGEYLEIHDFSIDKKKGIIYVPDFHKVHKYTADGEYIESIILDYIAPYLSYSANYGLIFFGGGRDDRLIIADTTGKWTSSYFPFSFKNNTAVSYPLSTFRNNNLVHLPTCDTIYKIKDGAPSPYYYLDFGELSFSDNDFEELSEHDKKNLQKHLHDGCGCITCYSFLESDENIFLQFRYSKNVYTGFFNKNTMQQTIINHNKLKNDLFNSFFYFNPIGTVNDEFILKIPAYKLLDNKENKIFSSKEFRKTIDKLNKYSNPVLFIVKPVEL